MRRCLRPARQTPPSAPTINWICDLIGQRTIPLRFLKPPKQAFERESVWPKPKLISTCCFATFIFGQSLPSGAGRAG